MTAFLARIRCALSGHDWEWGLPSGHSWCKRCARYDDHPAIVRAERIVRFVRVWTPLWLSVRHRDISAHVGWPHRRWSPSLNARLHFGWKANSELPGVTVSLDLWRLDAGLAVGFGWQNEDGDRSFVSAWLSAETYGLADFVCRYFGHKPERSTFSSIVTCSRCSDILERPDARIAA